ncbi:MAG: DUF5674 family protein [Acidimicrobiales bacterium]
MEVGSADSGIIMVGQPIELADLRELAAETFGDFVKAVVDVSRRVMALGAQLHSDEEAFLLERGSRQADLWGVNLYPAFFRDDSSGGDSSGGDSSGGEDFVEFDSMINLRPTSGNRSRSVEDPTTRQAILEVIGALVVSGG